jgi:hypothetical protein
VCFLLRDAQLTAIDLKRVVWLLHPEVQSVILMRAVFASKLLLPGMKMINPKPPRASTYLLTFDHPKPQTLNPNISLSLSLSRNQHTRVWQVGNNNDKAIQVLAMDSS